jgi:hypothetical protein
VTSRSGRVKRQMMDAICCLVAESLAFISIYKLGCFDIRLGNILEDGVHAGLDRRQPGVCER